MSLSNVHINIQTLLQVYSFVDLCFLNQFFLYNITKEKKKQITVPVAIKIVSHDVTNRPFRCHMAVL